jgi:hypothetical protein
VLRLVSPNLGWLVSLRGNTDIESIALRKPEARADSDRPWHVLDKRVVVGILLLEYADETLAANVVDALS